MGITIRSKRYSCDMGYNGFGRFRNIVAEKVGGDFCKHYLKLSSPEIMFLMGDSREDYFEKHNAITIEYVEKNAVSGEIANFLYQSDCGGKIDRRQSKQVFELIKDCDDNISFGYVGRSDCAKMSDMKKIFSDGTMVEWY